MKNYKSEIAEAVHEAVSDLHEIGLVDERTMREFGERCLMPVEKLTPDEIKAIRAETGLSASAFARHLWVSAARVEKWESGLSVPKGSALKLLTLVKNKGLECIA